MKRYCSVALVLLLVAFFSNKYSVVEGRSLLTMTQSGQVRDLQMGKDLEKAPVRGEKDSFRRVPTPASSSLPITLDSINPKVLKYEYAVRGEIVNIGH
ncbi:hypothetical protein ISN44_As06g017270 [Arabidopsis suecica]|uniref:Uncharacterized protein n=1 Tax=Arabidopsis suecica TaxID=45249 RepID=A0A8T2CGJ6_ARASU|nr:hypothetical protein ISN44_As06g017270 [Arabidopsis suecica]